MPAEEKLKDHISTAMADCKISEEEFCLVLSELTNVMKQEIQSNYRKTSGISEDEKKKFIAQGRQQSRQLFRAKTQELVGD